MTRLQGAQIVLRAIGGLLVLLPTALVLALVWIAWGCL